MNISQYLRMEQELHLALQQNEGENALQRQLFDSSRN